MGWFAAGVLSLNPGWKYRGPSMRMPFAAATLVLSLCMPVAHAYAQADFYKGKTITVVQIVDARHG